MTYQLLTILGALLESQELRPALVQAHQGINRRQYLPYFMKQPPYLMQLRSFVPRQRRDNSDLDLVVRVSSWFLPAPKGLSGQRPHGFRTSCVFDMRLDLSPRMCSIRLS